MPTNYKTVKGDTPNKIAAKFYGDRSKGYLIIVANQGLEFIDYPVTGGQEVLTGQDIIIPDQVEPTPASTPEQRKSVSLFDHTPPKISARSIDEVALLVKGRLFRTFDNLSIKFDYDKIANEFSFNVPFEPRIPEYVDAFKPIYQPTAIYIGGQLVITGQSYAVPDLSTDRNIVNVKGYSITGPLEKTSLPPPYEFDAGTSFSEIVVDVATRFGLAVVIDSAAASISAKPYEKRVEFSPGEGVGGKLATLARELGLILSSTYNGRLLVSKPITEGPVIQSFVSGALPAGEFKPNFNADALFTSYVGFTPDDPDEEVEATSQSLPGFPQPGVIPRIKAITPKDSNDQSLEDALKAERGRGYADWFNASLEVLNWRDTSGNLYQPNKLVAVQAPRAMIYSETKMLVRSVTLNEVSDRKTATFELILPEAFSGEELKITV